MCSTIDENWIEICWKKEGMEKSARDKWKKPFVVKRNYYCNWKLVQVFICWLYVTIEAEQKKNTWSKMMTKNSIMKLNNLPSNGILILLIFITLNARFIYADDATTTTTLEPGNNHFSFSIHLFTSLSSSCLRHLDSIKRR